MDNDPRVELSDWSSMGRGSHVDFEHNESIPLVQGMSSWVKRIVFTLKQIGQFLGRGAMGDVYETVIKGHKLAWKRMTFRRKIGEAERREIEILKKISHTHMIQLIGTYTHRQSIGLLLSPVAVCDLHTYFEDVEAFSQGAVLDDQQRARLTTLGHFSQAQPPLQPHRGKASSIYRNIGCLISTVAYLHEQKIRHKDLKPSNILLVPGGFYLSDFGSATDFSLLSQSATDNERGTPRYYAPEVAEWKPNGRAADIFSLGCVLLEIITLDEYGTLNDLRQLRTLRDSSFHANLEKIDKWLAELIISDVNYSPRQTHLKWEIRGMLARDPERRPKAQDLLKRVQSCDEWRESEVSIFGNCCRTGYISTHEFNRIKTSYDQSLEYLYER